MEKYCKNCGSPLNPEDEFCHDCGERVDRGTVTCANCHMTLSKDTKFCPNCGKPTGVASGFCPECGSDVEPNQDFCSECGTRIAAPKKPKRNLPDRQTLTVIGITVAVIAVVLVGAILAMGSFSQEAEPQEVEVGSTNFIIPGDFIIDPSTIDVDYQYSSALFAKGWSRDDGEMIYIATMTVPFNVNADDVLSSEGGLYQNMMGYDGYYTEEDGIYSFAFETGGYVCVVSVTDSSLLDEIECLG